MRVTYGFHNYRKRSMFTSTNKTWNKPLTFEDIQRAVDSVRPLREPAMDFSVIREDPSMTMREPEPWRWWERVWEWAADAWDALFGIWALAPSPRRPWRLAPSDEVLIIKAPSMWLGNPQQIVIAHPETATRLREQLNALPKMPDPPSGLHDMYGSILSRHFR